MEITKQQMLDKTPASTLEWAIQQILIRQSKTRTEQIRRVLNEIRNVLYTSAAKNLTLQELAVAYNEAETMFKKDNDKNKNLDYGDTAKLEIQD